MGSRLLTAYSDGVLVPSLLSRLTEPVVNRWPVRMFARLSGTLTGRDRAGTFSLTSSGALRYRAGPGARINYCPNPSAENGHGLEVSAGIGHTVVFAQDATTAVSGAFCARADVTVLGTGLQIALAGTESTTLLLATGNTVYTGSVSVRGTGQGVLRIAWINAAGGTIGSSDSPPITCTADWVRYSVTGTAPASAAQVSLRWVPSTTGQYFFDAAQIEDGSVATPYFDGSTIPTAAWLNPVTGQLGTAHNSPSVEWAQAWNEEGTTNEIPDPVFGNATITAHWGTVGAGTTLARTTAYAVPYGGVAAAQVTCDGSVAGQGLTLLESVAPAAASGQTKTAQVAARGSGTVKIQIVGLDSANAVTETFESDPITLDDTWKTFPDIPKLTATFANASTVKYVVRLVTTSAQAVTFYVGYVGAEAKSYATSPCHGSMGTGYSWSGTAHASSSTRADTAINLTAGTRLDVRRGTIVIWARWPGHNNLATLFDVDSNTNGGETRMFIQATTTNDRLTFGNKTGTGPYTYLTLATGLQPNDPLFIAVRYDGTLVEGSVNGAPLVQGTRDAPTTIATNTPIRLGDRQDQVAVASWNQSFGPVLIFDRPLTDAEIARLYNRGAQEANYDSIRAA